MENKTTKKIIASLFYFVVAIIAYGYLFNLALRLLNKSNTLCNNIGIVLIFMLCGVAILYAVLRYQEYKNKSEDSEDKSKSEN